jgi:hypothetical protein
MEIDVGAIKHEFVPFELHIKMETYGELEEVLLLFQKYKGTIKKINNLTDFLFTLHSEQYQFRDNAMDYASITKIGDEKIEVPMQYTRLERRNY